MNAQRVLTSIIVFCLSCSLAIGTADAQGLPSTGTSAVAWSADGQRLAVGGYDGTVQIIDSSTMQIIYSIARFGTFGGGINALSWSPDGRHLACTTDGKLAIWDSITQQQTVIDLWAPDEIVYALTWLPDGLGIGADGRTSTANLRVFSAQNGALLREASFGAHTVLLPSPDKSRVAAATVIGSVALWNSALTERVGLSSPTDNESKPFIFALSWNSDGTRLASGHQNGRVRVWDATSPSIPLLWEANPPQTTFAKAIRAVAFSSNGSKVSAITADGRLQIWNVLTGQLLEETQIGQTIYAAAFSPDGNRIALGGTGSLPTIVLSSLNPPTPTATPTSIPTLTPTSTPTHTPAPVSLRLQYYPDPDARGNLVESVEPDVNLVNTGTQAIPLSSLKIRYYFTRENPAVPVRVKCWFMALPGGCATVTGQVVALNPPVSGADSYLEIGFTGGTLAAGASTGEVLVGVNKTDWSDFDQRNDYSYTSRGEVFADWDKIAVYRDGRGHVKGANPSRHAHGATPDGVALFLCQSRVYYLYPAR